MAEKVKLSKDGSSIDFVQSESIPTSVKKFRQSPEIEGFYRFIFENDLQAAELIHDRFRLAEVLWRLEGLAQTQPLHPPPCSSHLFIVNPEGYRQKLLFKSHPSIEVRLQKLMGYYPI